jgi:AAA15 family ATPase/GTPase
LRFSLKNVFFAKKKGSLMLINFTVGNFLSFRDKKTLSLEASSIKDAGSQIIEVGKLQLLPSAALYGANSSGKRS